MKNEVSKQIALFDDSKRAVANLMARENITVQIVDGIPTASFDPITRVLSIPAWTKMSVEQIDTLMAHEVGHALFSDNSLYEKLRQDAKRGLFTYFNVVEDARIERKMRECFPGLTRTFHTGYKQFYADGPAFQGTPDGESLINPRTGAAVKITTFKLIDRINTYFKVGAFAKVPFTAEERVWVEKIARCSSMDEAIEIAKALHKLAKETTQEQNNPSNRPTKPTQTEQGDDQDENQDSGDDSQSSDSADSTDEQDSKDSDETESDSEASADESDDQDGDETDSDKSADSTDENDENTDEPADTEKTEDSDESDQGDETDESTDDGDKTDSDSTDAGDESDETEESEDGASQGDGAGESDGDDVAETVEGMEEALRKLAEAAGTERPQIRNLLISPVSDAVFTERTVSAKDWTAMMYAKFANYADHATVLDSFVTAWEEKHLNTAKMMALEFERRKTAKALINAKSAKTGKLNLSKLSQYRFTEDLFLRSMSVPQGKSHGVVMVIDASGSMSGCFASVIDQVLLFAHFAFQVNIPFEAYMFTDRKIKTSSDYYDWRADEFKEDTTVGLHQITLSDAGRLVGLVNTRTDRGQFKRQVRSCLALRYTFDATVNIPYGAERMFENLPYANLGGTPLFTGVMLGEKALGNMKKAARLDKTTFIVVTDGQDGNGLQYKTNTCDPSTGKVTENWEQVGTTAIVVRDTVTKKQFSYVSTSVDYRGREVASIPETGVISMLLDVIKARHDARTIYLYLQERGITTRNYGYSRYARRRAQVQETTIDGMNYLTRNEAVTIDTAAAIKALKDDGQFVLPVGRGVADLAIILRQTTIALSDDAFAKMDASQMTQRKIAAEFTKAMVKAVANRVFVNTVVPHLA